MIALAKDDEECTLQYRQDAVVLPALKDAKMVSSCGRSEDFLDFMLRTHIPKFCENCGGRVKVDMSSLENTRGTTRYAGR